MVTKRVILANGAILVTHDGVDTDGNRTIPNRRKFELVQASVQKHVEKLFLITVASKSSTSVRDKSPDGSQI